MVTIEDFGAYETSWCPGCGNFPILKTLKSALAASNIKPSELLMVSGIGQAAKMPHYLNANVFNGLHGRALPIGTAAKLVNPELNVIVESGDGCIYGEGGNHFLAALRRNVNLTLLAHNNQIYGLTKGQASPTSARGLKTKYQPTGVFSEPFNAIATAIALRTSFVARSFSGTQDHLSDMIQKAIAHKGLSFLEILHPCVSFNRLNTFAWYKKRCQELPPDYDPTDWEAAMKEAKEWEERIPIGIIYKCDRPTFDEQYPFLREGPLVKQDLNKKRLSDIMNRYL